MHIRRMTAALGVALFLPAASATATYIQVNLVSDVPALAPVTDAHLVNPWGIALAPEGLRVANNGTGVSTAYTGAGVPDPLVITVIAAPGSPPGTHSTPTGVVRNSVPGNFLTNFLDPNSAATLIFATQQGTITAWNTALGTTAINEVNAPGASYTGLAINQASDLIYAANFRNGSIDPFQGAASGFNPASIGNFVDPVLPAGYSPFNIQDLNGTLYVTYAQIDTQTGEEITGPGLGIVDAFDEAGNLLRRVTSGGPLNAPWGVAIAPADFGTFSNALLVGNFGDGRISAFDPLTGTFLGQLADANGQALAIDGLWGLQFGHDVAAGAHNQLFFAAGIGDERHGLFGRIEASAAIDEPGSLALALLGAALLVLARAQRARTLR